MRTEEELRARLAEVKSSRLLGLSALGITDYGKAQVLKGWREALEWMLETPSRRPSARR